MSDDTPLPRLSNLDDGDQEITRDIRRPSIPRIPPAPSPEQKDEEPKRDR